jgi:hypothetical protein
MQVACIPPPPCLRVCRLRCCCRLHYPELDQPDGTADKYVAELSALADWRQEQAARLPQMVWMDTGPQVGASRLLLTPGQAACRRAAVFFQTVLAGVQLSRGLGLRS